jgi:hypothetical protein
LKKQYSLDTNRFVLTGFSLGGSGTYHVIELMPDYWAAAIPAAAGGDTNQIESIAKTPTWHHQGSTDGTAGRRMSLALENHQNKVVRVVVDFNINSPGGWQTAVQGGAKPEDVAFKNAKAPVTLDSLRRAIQGGANYIYTELTGGNHEAGWMGAAHNPLLATWAFSKVRGGATVSIGYWKPNPNNFNFHSTNEVSKIVFDLQGRNLGSVRKSFSSTQNLPLLGH